MAILSMKPYTNWFIDNVGGKPDLTRSKHHVNFLNKKIRVYVSTIRNYEGVDHWSFALVDGIDAHMFFCLSDRQERKIIHKFLIPAEDIDQEKFRISKNTIQSLKEYRVKDHTDVLRIMS